MFPLQTFVPLGAMLYPWQNGTMEKKAIHRRSRRCVTTRFE